MWDGFKRGYGYNSRGEVTSATVKDSANALIPWRGQTWGFDEIGNRTTSGHSVPSETAQSETYTTNEGNAYTSISRTNPLIKLIQGLAHELADVEVFMSTGMPNAPAAGTTGVAAALDTSTGPAWRCIVVRASRSNAGAQGQPIATLRQGWMYFPPENETLSHDDDGNLTQDARWDYTWDGEPRPWARPR